MSQLTVFVFLVALTGISIVEGQKARCQGKIDRKGRWAGVCFGTQKRLLSKSKCDSLVHNAPGCKGGSCCVDCSPQTKPCHKEFSGSVGRNACCKTERKVGEVRPGSGCSCCKECKRKSFCRRKKGVCITDKDPVHNVEWCLKQPGGRVKERACYGWGCYCCIWNH